MNDIIVKNDFFDLQTINEIFNQCQNLTNGKEFIDTRGIFKGSVIAWQSQLLNSNININGLDHVLGKTLELFENTAKVLELSYVRLYLPWDIHCDMKRKNVIDIESDPFYNVLVPLHDVDSRTIIFDQQSSGYNEFWRYKEENPQHPNPITQELWDQYLSMCWPEDRLWLTIKEILPSQKAGQLVAFKRDLFHSSDNFHLRNAGPKHFLQIILNKKHEQNSN